ncbi:MAG: tRNA (adenosine(37)-N6)-threonylcarbamoyltransferase complex transferase subunit TsaD [Campylobacteraceae bacterium 4484_4]|nr:MAG: tRNA (adenosine(37)-N6)-threonylcarbamoyltransferase complex transferase subunit TsaD [Campylobacteraceae bacterium 4484_4]
MILSIESSCDDSAIAVTEIATRKLIFHKKISQEIDHAKYGGVVPELAARLHAEALPKILEDAAVYTDALKAVAVTNAPGLSVTLVEGVTMAKALHLALGIPMIAVNHLHGHIYSLFIEKEVSFPMTVLLVSGGHTQVIEANGYKDFRLLASTMDDSFGESFDKVAKMLGLGYPGGPIVETYAQKGDEERFAFTVPLANSPKIAFSYSGLKNQVRLQIEALGELSEKDRADICASFQKAATAHLIMKLKKLFKQNAPADFAIVGGASANAYLREKILELCEMFGVRLHLAPLEYCSDNAAMIGRCALEAYKREDFIPLEALASTPKGAI